MSTATEGTIEVERWRVECGDVLEVLARVPDKSVQCCVTSPPYWGLRDYGIEPSVWGGTAECDHEFDEQQPATAAEWDRAKWTQAINGRGQAQGTTDEFRSSKRSTSTTAFCTRCGAWRGCFGLEPTSELFIEHAVQVFREVRRVLRDDGTLWLNIGDSYYTKPIGSGSSFDPKYRIARNRSEGNRCNRRPPKGAKQKDLVGIPWMLAFALRADGWYLRSEIIWHKRSPMPESVRDRPTKAHEQIFLLTKSPRYFYDAVASAEPARGLARTNLPCAEYHAPGQRNAQVKDQAFVDANSQTTRNQRSVWSLSHEPFAGAHFATFPTEIPRRCLLAGTSERGCCAHCGVPYRRRLQRKKHDGVQWYETIGWKKGCACPRGEPATCLVLDPFNGAGTTGLVARKMGLRYLGIERSPENVRMSIERIREDAPLLNGVSKA